MKSLASYTRTIYTLGAAQPDGQGSWATAKIKVRDKSGCQRFSADNGDGGANDFDFDGGGGGGDDEGNDVRASPDGRIGRTELRRVHGKTTGPAATARG